MSMTVPDVLHHVRRNNVELEQKLPDLETMKKAMKRVWNKASPRDRANMWMGLPNPMFMCAKNFLNALKFSDWQQATAVRRLRTIEALHDSAKIWRSPVPGFGIFRC